MEDRACGAAQRLFSVMSPRGDERFSKTSGITVKLLHHWQRLEVPVSFPIQK